MTATAKIIDIDVARTVDDLGAIRAQIAELKLREDALAAAVKAAGFGAHEGALFRATVSEVAASSALDPKAAEAKLRELGVDGRWFSKHQKVRAASVRINVVARKGA